jgi:hypothetical protein
VGCFLLLPVKEQYLRLDIDEKAESSNLTLQDESDLQCQIDEDPIDIDPIGGDDKNKTKEERKTQEKRKTEEAY